MSLITLDTHAVVKDLMANGFSGEQAEAVTRAVREAQNIDLSNLATKTDIAEVRAELKAGIADLKADILKWMFSVAGLQVVTILGAAATFLHLVKP